MQRLRAAQDRLKGWEPGQPVIPAAATIEQARLETTILHRGQCLSTVSRNPMGTASVRPEPDVLTITLEAEPYAVRHWAQSLLPVDPGPTGEVFGVDGLRYTSTKHHVRLEQLGTGAVVKLTGFPTAWWNRAAAVIEADADETGEHPCFPSASICPAERYIEDFRADSTRDARFGSALLPRINLTTYPNGYGGTDLWSDPGPPGWEWKMETICVPDHARLIKQLTHPDLGLTLTGQYCHCAAPDSDSGGLGYGRSGCNIKFITAHGHQKLLVRDLRWVNGEKAQLRAAANRVKENKGAYKSHLLQPAPDGGDARCSVGHCGRTRHGGTAAMARAPSPLSGARVGPGGMISMPGCSRSHAATLAASRSGSRSRGWWDSQSTRMVPYRWPFLVANSSMPSTRGVVQTGSGHAMTRRRTVVRLTTMPSSSARRATARAARTTPSAASIRCRTGVRRP